MIDKDKIKKLTSTKDEAEKLKEIREKMLGSMVIYAVTCGVQTTLNTAMSSKVLNIVAFNAQLNSLVAVSNKLGLFSDFINQQALSSDYGANGNKVSLNSKDMAVSNIVNCKELGIIVVGNQYAFGAVNNQSTIDCTPLESYVIGAKALNKISLGIL